MSNFIRKHLPKREVAYYHGGMETSDRLKIQQQFLNDQIDIICSTSAFGMGINKRNIRFIIHYHLPTQLESYIQEIGRAGRDGKDSVSVLLYKEGDEQLPHIIVENEIPTEAEISFVFHQLFQLYQENKSLPELDQQIESFFQIDETKWRLLVYQLERLSVIKDEKIYFNKTVWQEAYREIVQFSEKRLTVKRRNIHELKSWIHSTGCLRKGLYERFEQPIEYREEQCCSNCGFSFSFWLTENDEQASKKHSDDWREKLAHILGVGY